MSKGTILVVEDETSVAQITKEFLENFGFDVCSMPSTGEEALMKARESLPDLVLMDIGLPGNIDGIEAARRIRFDLQIPIVFLTGNYDYEILERAKQAEPLGYMLKPYNGLELQSTIETALHQFHASRKRAKETLLSSEQRYRELAEFLPQVIFEVDTNGKIIYANQLAFKWFGYTPEDLANGLSVFDMVIPEDRETARTNFQNLLLGHRLPYSEYTARRKDGSSFDCGLYASVIMRDDQPIGLRGTVSDITERKLAEKALRHAEAKYRSMFENSIDAIFQTTPSGQLLTVNQAAADILGYQSPEELISKINRHDHRLFVMSGSRRELMQKLEERGAVKKFEFQAYRKDGSTVWLSENAWAVRDSRGSVLYYEGHAEDITEWKRAQKEREMMGMQLYQTHKLEAVGHLAAGIAHEINTPMQYVGDNVQFLLDAFGDLKSAIKVYQRLLAAAKKGSVDSQLISEVESELASSDIEYLGPEITKAIEQTLEGIERVSTIVGAMREFSHPGTTEKRATDIHKAIENTLVVCRNEWKYVAEIVTDFDPDLPLVPCVPGDFNQVILNLVVNAAQAIAEVVAKRSGEKGTITIQTRSEGRFAEIRVRDTGSGIPEEARSKIFNPFFTTKGIGEGTGQGLFISYSTIVRKHGGSLTYQTEIGRGTTFVIRLPLDQAV
jgi:two-component system NtrC family sensor kinase